MIPYKIKDSIHLAACGINENLPSHPNLPCDLFTSCLTTPIKTALHWYVTQKNMCQLVPGLTIELLDQIPGMINDRRTMLGELNWIFTSITDTIGIMIFFIKFLKLIRNPFTIAWNILDTETFQKLFRQDLLVASLFRNFLLAERIMKSFDCNPVSSPSLPKSSEHKLWLAWDLALDICITQLPEILNAQNPKEFVTSGFFSEQIEIFDVWLKYNGNSKTPPEQLPIVLQVLLSQQHRLKALELLCSYLDFGTFAVTSALSVGIFPYVLKLLGSPPKEIKILLTFIWAKILAVDKSCQAELIKDNCDPYFINVLSDQDSESSIKVYSAFVLSCYVEGDRQGQENAKQNHLITNCAYLICDKENKDFKDPLIRQWCSICLGLVWKDYSEAKWEGVRNNAFKGLIDLIQDPIPEVRAAAVFALATSIECGKGNEGSDEQANKLDAEIVNALIKDYDSVYIVRKEIIVALYNYMMENDLQFVNLACQEEESMIHESLSGYKTSLLNSRSHSITSITYRDELLFQSSVSSSSVSSILTPSTSSILLPGSKQNNLATKVWRLIIEFLQDPHPQVAQLAQKVYDAFINYSKEHKRNSISESTEQKSSSFKSNAKMRRSLNLIRDPTIKTEFVAWCSNYFLKAKILNVSKKNDLYKSEFLDQHCKLLYNNKMKKKTIKEWKEPQQMEETLAFKHSSLPLHCKFHPYDDLLYVADKDNNISIYDTIKTLPKLKFSNHTTNKRNGKITSLNLISPHYEPLVLTSTDDYVVRLFKPDLISTSSNDPFLTAFVAFNKNEKVFSVSEKAAPSIEAGLVSEWEEVNNNLICAGDFRNIRIWDMNKELHKDYPTDVPSCVTSLTSNSNYSVAGFGDGEIFFFPKLKTILVYFNRDCEII
jgi:regulator-associated protein of mTOR